MKRDARTLGVGFHDGDIVDVYLNLGDGPPGVERVDFGGVETYEGVTQIVNFLVRADVTSDSIAVEDIADIRLVQPWTARSASDLLTNIVGAGSRPASQSALALNGKRFSTKRAMDVLALGSGGRHAAEASHVELAADTIVTVTLADPDATQFLLKAEEDACSFVLAARQLPELLDEL